MHNRRRSGWRAANALQVWSGGHDARLCAVTEQCRVAYQVGDLKGAEVAHAGGTKAIHRVGYNVWVFGLKTVQVYSAHCITDEVSHKVRCYTLLSA